MRRLLPLLIAFLALTAFVVPAPSAHAAWVWPVAGKVITPYRNGTDPYATGQHRGIDIAAPVGAPVVAATGGEVRFAGMAGTSGLTISVRTGDGYDTSYLHLSSLSIRAGAHVSTGQRIGAVGVTGVRSATAPHLHFGVRDAGTRHDYRDPLAFLPPPPASHSPPAPSPAPAPAPAPAPPATAPVGRPRTAPAPRAAPRPVARRLPAPHRLPHDLPAPHRLPLPRSTPDGVPTPLVVPHRLSAQETHRPATIHMPGRETAAPGIGSSAGATHAATAATTPPHPATPPHAPTPSRVRDKPGSGGPDLAWAGACAGLLLAAAVLSMSDERRHRATRTTKRVHAALRPLARLTNDGH
jgi:hypothetical protein